MSWLPAVPNFERLAQVFGKELDSSHTEITDGYFDTEGRLWILGRKWHTKKLIKGVYSPSSGVPPEYHYERIVPYLYFWLYDTDGSLVAERALGDSVGNADLFHTDDNGTVIIWRCRTDIGIRMSNPTSGYIRAIYINRKGIVTDTIVVTTANTFYHDIADFWQGVFVGLGLFCYHGGRDPSLFVSVDCDSLVIIDDSYQIPGCNFLQQLDSTHIFTWGWVDTITRYEYDDFLDQSYPVYERIPGNIQTQVYDLIEKQWKRDRYSIAEALFRKYYIPNLFPISHYVRLGYEPIVQSLMLKNKDIVVTIFTVEGEDSVAYQMLFDPYGQLIPVEERQISKPEDIAKIPENCALYIERSLAINPETHKYRGRGTDVYIWGYDIESGQLYLRKYFLE